MASSTSTTETPADAAPDRAAPDGAELPADAAIRLLLFGVGGRVYGCDIGVVREILPVRKVTRLPGAPRFVGGLINLRGTIVTLLDLGVRLGSAPVDPTTGSIVIVEHGTKVVGLVVDDVRDVQPLAAGDIDPVVGDEAHGGLTQGLGRVGGGVVVVLDVRAMVGQVLL